MITTILFDLDGTLIDHVTAIEGAAGAVFDEFMGHTANEHRAEFVERWKALNREWYLRFFAQQVNFQQSARGKLRDAFLPFEIHFSDEFADVTIARYLENYVTLCRPFEDVGRCLSRLKMYKLGVITNGQEMQQVEKIRRCGLIPMLNAVVTSEAAGTAKPNSQIFRNACDQLSVPAHEAVYVGDNLELDAIAARDAGMTGIWLNRLGGDPTSCPPDITTIGSLDELVNGL